jgi:putative Mg2+ transporter-C (MgtC) family protein
MDLLDVLRQEFGDLPDWNEFFRVMLRMFTAVALGGLVGLEREAAGKAAGLRTHSLVTLGAAVVMMVASSMSMSAADQSRVIQGLVTGIGFIGGGAILKITDERRIQGITTASGIWMTASIGIAVGAGKLTIAVIATGLTFVVLSILRALEERLFSQARRESP